MYTLIQTQAQLDEVLLQLQHAQYCALDTEFIKVDTLRPKLGVLQLNIANQVYLLDGVALDLSALWPKLFQVPELYLHACGEDVDLIYAYAQQKPIENILDTQTALSFLGYGLQVSYQNAIKLMLNIDLAKDQTRSDWLARPLSTQQLNYAADDVLYLPELVDVLRVQLQQHDIESYVREDCRNWCAEIATQLPLTRCYLDVANYRHNRRQLAQLQSLCAWREQYIQTHNIPRSFLLRNSSLMDLVEKNPHNLFQLSKVRDIKPQALREHGKTILELMHNLPDEQLWPNRLAKPPRFQSESVEAEYQQILAKLQLQTGIPTEVLLRKKWLNALLLHAQDANYPLPSYLLGWRYEQLTQPILKLFREGLPQLDPTLDNIKRVSLNSGIA